jgi:hypothetical protein
MLLTQQPARYAFETVDQLGQLHMRRIVHKQVNMVIVTIHLYKSRFKVLTNLCKDNFKRLQVMILEDMATVLWGEHQMRMYQVNAMSTASIFQCRFHNLLSHTKSTNRLYNALDS